MMRAVEFTENIRRVLRLDMRQITTDDGRMAFVVVTILTKAEWYAVADYLDRHAWRYGAIWDSDASRNSVAASPCDWARTWFRFRDACAAPRVCRGSRGGGRAAAAKRRRSIRARIAFDRARDAERLVWFEDMPVALALMGPLARSIRGPKGDRLGPYNRGVRPQ